MAKTFEVSLSVPLACSSVPPNKSIGRDSVTILSTFAGGLGSGFLSSIVCAPLDLLKTRLQVWNDVMGSTSTNASANPVSLGQQNARPSIFHIINDIIKREGPVGLFRGLGVTLVTGKLNFVS